MDRTVQRPQCPICLQWIKLSEASALNCGHLFHFPCIMNWVTSWSNCPVCRKEIVNEDQVIRQLFFQVDDTSYSDHDYQIYSLWTKVRLYYIGSTKHAPQIVNAGMILPLIMIEDISEELKISCDTNATLRADDKKHCVRYNQLKSELQEERETSTLLKKTVQDLETKVEHTNKELKLCKKGLQASEFYQILSSQNENPLPEMDKYVGEHGIEVSEFISLLRAQLSCARNTIADQKKEMEEMKKSKDALQEKLDAITESATVVKEEADPVSLMPSEEILRAMIERVIAHSAKDDLLFRRDDSCFAVSDWTFENDGKTVQSCGTGQRTAQVRKETSAMGQGNSREPPDFNSVHEVIQPKLGSRLHITYCELSNAHDGRSENEREWDLGLPVGRQFPSAAYKNLYQLML
ncbi:unnamed protein product [Thelazia callipaeda]|uniref:RING-type domain-containing protein n=1 Tax=Thelazia callipaeda TaxID=103827 RepID=A0A0N5D1N1_THECL|nr:unnamed protein product [Thelazia callipaeda]